MIIAETSQAYRFVTQPAHARLAGRFARHWGGNGFDPPTPFPSVVMAAESHDDGWLRYDRCPRLSADRTPETFTELGAATWIDIYDRGIDAAVSTDRYMGLLISMHGTGLRRQRYGLSPSWPDTPRAFEEFVGRQEANQRRLLEGIQEAPDDDRISEPDARLLEELHATGTAPAKSESRLWTNYRLLQAWDTLSLAYCTTMQPPARPVIGNVPQGRAASTTTLSLDAIDGNRLTVEPYPFSVEPLDLQMPFRRVEKAAFETEDELLNAYHAAARDYVEVSMHSAE